MNAVLSFRVEEVLLMFSQPKLLLTFLSQVLHSSSLLSLKCWLAAAGRVVT